MTHRKPACVLLDMGKVLVDFDLGRFRDFLREHSSMSTEELRQALVSDGLPAAYECGRISDGEFHAEVCRRLRADIPWEDFVRGWNSIFIDPPIVPEEYLGRLAGHAAVWIVSNTNRLHFEYVREAFGWARHASGFVLSYEVGAAKPERRIFEAALGRAGARPEDTVFVDDQGPNVEAALGLGIDAFLFSGADDFLNQLAVRGLSLT